MCFGWVRTLKINSRHNLTWSVDSSWQKLKAEYTGHLVRQRKYSDAIKDEEKRQVEKQNIRTLRRYRVKEKEYAHKSEVSALYVNAREAELLPTPDTRRAERLRSLAAQKKKDWAEHHSPSKSFRSAASTNADNGPIYAPMDTWYCQECGSLNLDCTDVCPICGDHDHY